MYNIINIFILKLTYVEDCEMDLAKDTGAPTISPKSEQIQILIYTY